jgi:transposase
LALLTTLIEQIKALSTQIGQQLEEHADKQIFTSLPRSGTVRAARLLAEIGDCRDRFPSPDALICLAGVAPATRQSGKSRSVGFRWACDKQRPGSGARDPSLIASLAPRGSRFGSRCLPHPLAASRGAQNVGC